MTSTTFAHLYMNLCSAASRLPLVVPSAIHAREAKSFPAVTAFLYQCCVQSCFPTPLIADIPTTVPLNLCFRYSSRLHRRAI